LVQSAVLAVAGQRLELLLGGVVLLLLAGRIGLSLSLRQWVYAAAVGGIFMVAITGVRADQGREIFYSDTGLVARFEALGRGLGDPRLSAGPQGTGSVVGEAALRLDSNSWTGNVAMALDGSGGTTTGVAVVLGSVLAMVPSVIYTGKLAVDVYQRDPESAAIVYLGLPPSDYLPGHLTILYGALTWPQLLLVMLGVGLVLGNVESRVCGNSGPFAMLGYMLLLIAAVFYERGLVSGYLSAGRSFVIMAGVLGLTNWAGRNRSTLKGLHAARQPVQSARHGSGTHG
jgi:hypothetical protein